MTDGGASGIERVVVRVLPDGRLSRNEAAKYLGRSSKTLAQWAMQGRGPRVVKISGRAFYFKTDLDSYIASGGDAPRRNADGGEADAA